MGKGEGGELGLVNKMKKILIKNIKKRKYFCSQLFPNLQKILFYQKLHGFQKSLIYYKLIPPQPWTFYLAFVNNNFIYKMGEYAHHGFLQCLYKIKCEVIST